MNIYHLFVFYVGFITIVGSCFPVLAQTDDESTMPKHFIQLKTSLARGSSTIASRDEPFLGFGNDMLIAGGSASYPQFGLEYAYQLRPNLYIGTGLNFLAYQPDFSVQIARSFFDEIGFNAQIPAEYQSNFSEDSYSKYHNKSNLGYEISVFLNYCLRISGSDLYWHFTPAFAVRGLWKNPNQLEDFITDEWGNLLKILEVEYNTKPSIGWRFETGPSWHFKDRHIIGIQLLISNAGVDIMEANYSLLPEQTNERNGKYRFEGSFFGIQLKYAMALSF